MRNYSCVYENAQLCGEVHVPLCIYFWHKGNQGDGVLLFIESRSE